MNNTDTDNAKSRIKQCHIRAIQELKKLIPETFGMHRELLEKSEMYHMTCLHRRWFSVGRRENEKRG